MSSSSSVPKQQQRRSKKTNHSSQQSRNTNAYFERNECHPHALNDSKHYWNDDYYPADGDSHLQNYYPPRHGYPSISRRLKKDRSGKNQHSKSIFTPAAASNPHSSYYATSVPPRRHLQPSDEAKPLPSPPLMTNGVKPSQSPSSTSTNSDAAATSNRKDLQTKNLAAAAIAARQQNQSAPSNLGAVQTLMNSLILQQQAAPSQPSSTVHLQNQLTNALLATSKTSDRTSRTRFAVLVIQQRLKEAALQAQAQHIQAALPTILAAQALAYQQQQQLAGHSPTLPANVAHPGTKFNNRPLVKFPVVRPPAPSFPAPMMFPVIRPTVLINPSRHRLTTNTQHTASTTALPTYQQVQEIERGISLDEAIQLKNAIDIATPSSSTLLVE